MPGSTNEAAASVRAAKASEQHAVSAEAAERRHRVSAAASEYVLELARDPQSLERLSEIAGEDLGIEDLMAAALESQLTADRIGRLAADYRDEVEFYNQQ